MQQIGSMLEEVESFQRMVWASAGTKSSKKLTKSYARQRRAARRPRRSGGSRFPEQLEPAQPAPKPQFCVRDFVSPGQRSQDAFPEFGTFVSRAELAVTLSCFLDPVHAPGPLVPCRLVIQHQSASIFTL